MTAPKVVPIHTGTRRRLNDMRYDRVNLARLLIRYGSLAELDRRIAEYAALVEGEEYLAELGGEQVGWARTSAYLGVPASVSRSIVKAGTAAEDNGWVTRSTYTTKPPTVVVRFHRDGFPRVYATWHNGRFYRAYARTCQRLGYTDLLAVLADPQILLDVDPDNPFAVPDIECHPRLP